MGGKVLILFGYVNFVKGILRVWGGWIALKKIAMLIVTCSFEYMLDYFY